jgi:hypothetical protein
MGQKTTHRFIIGTFVLLYLITSVISTIHVIDFFRLSNPEWLAISLAVAFEIGAAASLASIIVMEKMNKAIVWILFFVLTAMQAMGNAYFAYTNIHDYQSWVELFGLVDAEVIEQKRILSVISGAILPLVALGFIKALVDYLRPGSKTAEVSEGVKDDEGMMLEGPFPAGWKPIDITTHPGFDHTTPSTNDGLNDGVNDGVKTEEKHPINLEEIGEKLKDRELFPEKNAAAKEFLSKAVPVLPEEEDQKRKETLIKKWKDAGYLENLKGNEQPGLSDLLEAKTPQVINEAPTEEPSILDKIKVFKSDGNK